MQRHFLRAQKGASTVEYVTILMLVLGFALFVIWGTIAEQLEMKLTEAGFDAKVPGKRKPKARPAKPAVGESNEGGDAEIIGGGGSTDGYAPVPVPSSGTAPARKF